MTTPATPSGKSDDVTPIGPSFEDSLRAFWEKNGTIVIAFAVIVFVGIVGKGLWDRHQESADKEIQAEYAAATTPEKLKAFAAAHPDHPLAGVVELRNADEAYTAGKYAEAITGYDAAATKLKGSPLAARAPLGRAMALVQSGKTAEGETVLKSILADANAFKGVRLEAGYQLASLASAAGRASDVQTITAQLTAIDETSTWTQRAVVLRGTLPPSAAPAAAPAAGAPAAPEIKVPGK